jgi:hypothetical protein
MPAGRLLIACFLALLVGACGCGSGSEDRPAQESRAADSSPDSTRVIRAWADTLRRGDVGGAASYFTLPTLVQNGTPPLALYTRAQVREFNAALPCGARLLRTYASGSYTTAVFRLTERPGAGRCGTGAGLTARTRFLIRHGKIREWRRVPDEPAPSAPSAPVV